MINNQLGGDILALPNSNILDNLDTEDDINSIFMNLEENNINLMANFVNQNNILLDQFDKNNQNSIEHLKNTQVLVINNPDNFIETMPNPNLLNSSEKLKDILDFKSQNVSKIGFSTINPDDDDDDSVDKLLLNKIRLFGNSENPLFMKINKEIDRRQKLKINRKEQIAKKQLAKLLQLEKNNRHYEIKAKNAQLFKDKQFRIKKYAIKTFAGIATIGVGVVLIPYIMGPEGLIQTLTHIFGEHFYTYLTPDLIDTLGGNISNNADAAFELAKIVQNLVKSQQIQIVFSVYTILSAGAESRGDAGDHISLMLEATKEESKNIVKGFITYSMRPLVQNKVTGILSNLLKNTQLKSPLVFTFFGKLSGYVASDVTTYILEKIKFFEPAGKIQDKKQKEKLKNKNIADINELENLFKQKSTFEKLQTGVVKEYNYFTETNPKMTAAISIVGCIGMSNLLVGLMNYSWDGVTELTGDYLLKPMDNFLGINFFNEQFLENFVKKLFTTKTVFEHFKRNYIIPFLRTQLREIVSLDYIWTNNIKKLIGYKKSDEWKSWKEIKSNNAVRKIGVWLFIYIFDLPKRFLEEEIVYGLASCLSDEKKPGENDNCNNIHDIAHKLYSYEEMN